MPTLHLALTASLPVLLAASGEDLQRVRDAVVLLIALVLSIAVHEYGHAIVADKLGDRTPRYQGRCTLNPLVHADPIGTIMFPLFGFFYGGLLFGWGKPVLVNPASFTRRLQMKVAHMLVAAAGPAMNVVLGILVTLVYAGLALSGVVSPLSEGTRELANGIIQVIRLNWILFFFNLIPCPPLDGGTILAGLLPDRYQNVTDFLRQYGFIILIALLLTPALNIFLQPALWISSLSINWVHGLIR